MSDRVIHLSISEVVNDSEPQVPDCVVWNAWIDKCRGIADMEDEDYKRYVCVEPGSVWGTRSVKGNSFVTLKQCIQVQELSFVGSKQLISLFLFASGTYTDHYFSISKTR